MSKNQTNSETSPKSIFLRKSANKYYAICSSHVVVGEGDSFDSAYENLLTSTTAHAKLARDANFENVHQPDSGGFRWEELKLFLAKLLLATVIFGILIASLTMPLVNVVRELAFNATSPYGSSFVDAAYQLRLKGMAVIEKLENMDPPKKAALAADLRRVLEQLRPFLYELKEFQDSLSEGNPIQLQPVQNE